MVSILFSFSGFSSAFPLLFVTSLHRSWLAFLSLPQYSIPCSLGFEVFNEIVVVVVEAVYLWLVKIVSFIHLSMKL